LVLGRPSLDRSTSFAAVIPSPISKPRAARWPLRPPIAVLPSSSPDTVVPPITPIPCLRRPRHLRAHELDGARRMR
jgi:hypothetical protein